MGAIAYKVAVLRNEWVTASEERQAQIERQLDFLNSPNKQIGYMGKIVWDGEKEIGPFYSWEKYQKWLAEPSSIVVADTQVVEEGVVVDNGQAQTDRLIAAAERIFAVKPEVPVDLFALPVGTQTPLLTNSTDMITSETGENQHG